MPQTDTVNAVAWGMLVFVKEKNPMVHPTLSVLTEQDEGIREVTPANAVLLRRLGLEALPARETMIVPSARLIVVGADHLARSA